MSEELMPVQAARMGAAPLLLTVRDMAQRLRMSVATVWRLRDAGKLPQPVRLGACVRWRLADVEAWLADGCPEVAPRTPRR